MRRKKNWNIKDQAVFLERLGSLCENGYTLGKAIELLQFHYPQKQKNDLADCLVKLRQGNPFHQILDHFTFPKDVLGVIYFSEKQGNLAQGLLKSSKMLKLKWEHYQSFVKAVRYPLLLSVILFTMLVVLSKWILPQFITMYQSLRLDLPVLTTFMLSSFQLIPRILQFLFATFFGIAVYFVFFYQKQSAIAKMERLMRIPGLRKYVSMSQSYFLSMQLSQLLHGGLAIHDALTIFEQQTHMPFFQEEAQQLKALLKRGESFAAVIHSRPYYEQELPIIITHGEANGTLAEDLRYYSEIVLKRMQDQLQSLFNTIQPVLFILIGASIMLVFLSIMLPIFQLIHNI